MAYSANYFWKILLTAQHPHARDPSSDVKLWAYTSHCYFFSELNYDKVVSNCLYIHRKLYTCTKNRRVNLVVNVKFVEHVHLRFYLLLH